VAEVGPASAGELAHLRRAWSGTGPDAAFDARFARWWAAESGRRLAWVAVEDGAPVGMVNLTVFERMPWPGRPPSRWGYLGNAYVLPQRRDRGIGTALLTTLLEHARTEGYARLVLSPSARSVPFYRRAGFGPASALLLHPLP
jgi:GNAT superfamily N-acetyltransferase